MFVERTNKTKVTKIVLKAFFAQIFIIIFCKVIFSLLGKLRSGRRYLAEYRAATVWCDIMFKYYQMDSSELGRFGYKTCF